jgi:hypothetical protein
MSEPVYDKHGIRIFPDVARLDPYGEATLKRFSVAKLKPTKIELETLCCHYFCQGCEMVSTVHFMLREEASIDPFVISRLLRKAAVAFDEAGNVDSILNKKGKAK